LYFAAAAGLNQTSSVKNLFPVWLVSLVCLALAGCESVRNDFGAGLSEKINGPTYQHRVLADAPPAVFERARMALDQLGFRITRAGAAQGIIEGVSGLATDDRLRGSRQRTVKVRLESTLDEGTDVAVLFTEVVEDDFSKGAGQGTETSLRNHPLYDAFWADLGVPTTP
jgi:hypothetical protein